MAKGTLLLSLIGVRGNFRRNSEGTKSEALHFNVTNYTLFIIEILTNFVHGEEYFTFEPKGLRVVSERTAGIQNMKLYILMIQIITS